MNTHSIIIVGCGSIGERHLRCFQKTGRCQVSAADTNPELLERIGRDYKVDTLKGWNFANKEGFDAAVICTPAPLHIPMATEGAKNGLHILIEKPLSTTFEGLEALKAAQSHGERQIAVAYVYHSFPYLIAAGNFLKSGSMGPIKQVTVCSGSPFHRLRPAYADTYYSDHKLGGGAIQDGLTHLVNWVESVLGPTKRLFCDCSHQVLPNVDVEDTVHVVARNGGALVNYTMNQFQAANETTIQFNAAETSVRIEFARQRWGTFQSGDSEWTWHETQKLERDDFFTAQANAFLDQIEGRASRLCSLDEAVQSLRFNIAALRSSDKGTVINCADILNH